MTVPLGFILGVIVTIMVGVILAVTFPVWWLLTGGDLGGAAPVAGRRGP